MTTLFPARRPTSALAVAGTVMVAVLVSVLAAEPAQGYPLSMKAAEQASGAAVAPAPIELVRCFRQPGVSGQASRRRAFCTVVHGTHDGETCRSFALVRSPRGAASSAGPIRVSVFGSNVCQPEFTGIEP